MNILKADSLYHHALCVYLRTIVFIQEQGYSVEEEIYDDEDDATYFLVLENEATPVATGRYRVLDGDVAQLERICVARDYRSAGHGAKIVEAILNDAQKVGCHSVFAFIKEETFPFYERYGFDMLAEHYTFAGVAHCKIERPL